MRYTEIGREGVNIVPLVRFCDERGNLPQDGQYVPRCVIDKLAWYEQAEEDGEMAVFPAKRGDTVYCLTRTPKGFMIEPTAFAPELHYDFAKMALRSFVSLSREEAELKCLNNPW